MRAAMTRKEDEFCIEVSFLSNRVCGATYALMCFPGTSLGTRCDLCIDVLSRYIAGDACRRDEDGYYWITGRIDDVINVSGHRIGTAEVCMRLSVCASV